MRKTQKALAHFEGPHDTTRTAEEDITDHFRTRLRVGQKPTQRQPSPKSRWTAGIRGIILTRIIREIFPACARVFDEEQKDKNSAQRQSPSVIERQPLVYQQFRDRRNTHIGYPNDRVNKPEREKKDRQARKKRQNTA